MYHWRNCGCLKHPGFNDMGKGDAPAPPNYAAAAQATAQGDKETARVAAKANRVSQYTPYGNLTYSQGQNYFDQAGYDAARKQYADQYNKWTQAKNEPEFITDPVGYLVPNPKYVAKPKEVTASQYNINDPDRWFANVTLSPEQQQLLDQQNKISLGLGTTMDRGLGYVQDMLDSPLDTSAFTQVDPASVAGREQVTAALLERMQPSMDRQRQLKENALLIGGHNRGGEAWNAAQDDIARAENDARLAAINAGGAEQSRLLGLQQALRQNELAETQTLRNEPLNTLNAVRTGAQVTNPQFVNVPQQQATRGPDLLGAAQAQYGADMNAYNAQQQGASNMMGGLFSLGSAAFGSPWAGGMFGF